MRKLARLSAGIVSFVVMIVVLITGVIELIRNLGYTWQLWKWPFLLSPAFYLYCGVSLAAVYFPILGCTVLAHGLAIMKLSQARGLYMVALAVLGVVFANYACQLVAWGSFPLTREASGDLYLRMIPFIPWPDHPFYW